MLIAGAIVLRTGLAQLMVRQHPLAAAAIAPSNGEIATAAARAALEAGAKPGSEKVRGLVTAALARDTSLTAALELRALDETDGGSKSRAQALFLLSNTISRRSLSTRVWLVQRAVEHGDVEGALRNMDLALRTSLSAPQLIFPALTRAIDDPALIPPIARMVDRPSEWRAAFLDTAARKAHPAAAAGLLLAMRDRRAVTTGEFDRKLIARLVGSFQFALARRLEQRFNPSYGASPLLADGGFTGVSARHPFGWGLVDESDMGAAFSRLAGRPVLSYRALPARTGQVAAQLLMLAPGRFRLAAATAQIDDPAAPPRWLLTCAERGGGQIASLDQPVRAGGAAAAAFAVPADCPAQWLTLRLRPSLATAGQSGAIASVAIARD
jgi:hypothetical protein